MPLEDFTENRPTLTGRDYSRPQITTTAPEKALYELAKKNTLAVCRGLFDIEREGAEIKDARDFADPRLARINFLKAGGMIFLSESLGYQLGVARRLYCAYAVRGEVEEIHREFALELDLRIGNIALGDVILPKREKQASLLDIHRLLTLSYVCCNQMDWSRISSANAKQLDNLDPALAEYKVRSATLIAVGLTALAAEDEKKIISSATGDQALFAKRAEQVAGRIGVAQEKLRNALLDPSSADFKTIKEVFSGYLADPDTFRPALYCLGLNIVRVIFDTYRRARQWALGGTEAEVYNLLAERVVAAIGVKAKRMGVLKASDLPEILESGDLPADSESLLSIDKNSSSESLFFGLRPLLASINRGSSGMVFELDPKQMEWTNGVRPSVDMQSITLMLDESNRWDFYMNLMFGEPCGEELEIAMFADPRRRLFDWNVLEFPHEEKAERHFKALLITAEGALRSAKSIVDNQAKVKRVEEARPNVPQNAGKVEDKNDRQERREERRKMGMRLLKPIVLTPIKQVLTDCQTVPSDSEVSGGRPRDQIVLTKECLQRIDPSLRERVKETVKRFNQRQAGGVTLLAPTSGNQARRELRIGSHRLLLEPMPAKGSSSVRKLKSLGFESREDLEQGRKRKDRWGIN